MPKTPSQLQRDIDRVCVIAPVLPKWRRAIAAYKKAIADLESGGDDWQKASSARNRLDKIIDEAAGYCPGNYTDPAIDRLRAEQAALPRISTAQERGRKVREELHRAELKAFVERERELKAKYDVWKR